MRNIFAIALLVLVTGCGHDSREQSATNLSNVKTQVAAKEYQAATTPAAKDAIATEYFATEPKFTQVIDDYAHGRPPSVVVPLTEKP